MLHPCFLALAVLPAKSGPRCDDMPEARESGHSEHLSTLPVLAFFPPLPCLNTSTDLSRRLGTSKHPSSSPLSHLFSCENGGLNDGRRLHAPLFPCHLGVAHCWNCGVHFSASAMSTQAGGKEGGERERERQNMTEYRAAKRLASANVLPSCALATLLEKLLQATHVPDKPLELIQSHLAVIVQILSAGSIRHSVVAPSSAKTCSHARSTCAF